jgi:hypothetical protein
VKGHHEVCDSTIVVSMLKESNGTILELKDVVVTHDNVAEFWKETNELGRVTRIRLNEVLVLFLEY